MKRSSCVVTLGVILAGSAHALTAVRPIEGYVCMRLKWTGSEADAWDESKLPAIYGAPSASAQRVGTIGARAIVASPLHVESGFAEILRLDGKKGWIKADLLLPYPKSTDPSKTCVPSYMSDGGVGFGTVKN